MKKEKVTKQAKVEKQLVKVPANKGIYKKTIENHMQAAYHHLEAAKHHREAAKHYEGSHFEKGARSTLLALGHHAIAGEFLNDDAKHHAQTLKETHYQ